MTTRNDIIDGRLANNKIYGLIYTKKCGWVDLGHANPRGALVLWNKIKFERDEKSDKPGYFRVSYSQKMGNRHFKVGISKRYDIKKGCTIQQNKSIALTIFLNTSVEFERMQGNWLFRKLTNSSFSAEDLVSNLIGFYRAVEPGKRFIQLCEPLSKNVALKIWDKYGAVGNNKNYGITPHVYPLGGSPSSGPMNITLPHGLNSIKPAKQGALFSEVKSGIN